LNSKGRAAGPRLIRADVVPGVMAANGVSGRASEANERLGARSALEAIADIEQRRLQVCL
jgi:hypothetical protein